MGLVDEVVNKTSFKEQQLKWSIALSKKDLFKEKSRKVFSINYLTTFNRKSWCLKASRMDLTQGNYPAPVEIINCVEIGLNNGLEKGYEAEVEKFEQLALDVSKALRGLFFTD